CSSDLVLCQVGSGSVVPIAYKRPNQHPGGGARRDGVAAAFGGAHGPVGGQPGQAALLALQEDARGDVVGGGQGRVQPVAGVGLFEFGEQSGQGGSDLGVAASLVVGLHGGGRLGEDPDGPRLGLGRRGAVAGEGGRDA